MVDRRSFLTTVSLTGVCAVSGCLDSITGSADVAIHVKNTTLRRHVLSLVVSREGERVFQTEKTVPADDHDDSGQVSFPAAFRASEGDQFDVKVDILEMEIDTYEGPIKTFEYEVTCADNNLDDEFFIYLYNRDGGQYGTRIDFDENYCSD